ncbi:low molecular weight protein-tyrosine-phosphatase [Alkalilacustris brevis]|uniref:low molecular weight protein-tyrosine-phosphatase n=1 Tax=Alkalilacustris brevis TaxID=2026338 RepID=UPI000E0CFEB7|nr:low molecular weight protein-tyrosine-phosphatase [Alkalilacustris brevis]
MTQRLLTVCTGNICRSPVAEAAFRQALPGVIVRSAGLHALVGHDIDRDSASAARAHGIEIQPHRAQQFSDELGRDADVIFVMENHHRSEMMSRWPHLIGKTFLLGHFEQGKEIPDPYKRGQAMHLQMAELVLESVRQWAEQLENLK